MLAQIIIILTTKQLLEKVAQKTLEKLLHHFFDLLFKKVEQNKCQRFGTTFCKGCFGTTFCKGCFGSTFL
jgi:hypothetical protein